VSTAARKARKRAGEPMAVKPAKEATPLEQRSDLAGVVLGAKGTRYAGLPVDRSLRKLVAERKARGIEAAE